VEQLKNKHKLWQQQQQEQKEEEEQQQQLLLQQQQQQQEHELLDKYSQKQCRNVHVNDASK